MKSLSIKNLHKKYDQTEVLRGIDISLESGEFLVLVGPSGCGKSTLLSCIAGLEEITSGSIKLGEKDITHASPKDRELAMVFQSYALYPNMTVRQNIEFGLKISKYSKEEIENRIQSAASMLQIKELLNRKPAQLSGGQRQRIAIARSISREPSIYLFDEPLSNLDAELRVRMRAEIKKLHKKVKKTIVYVTHDQIEAMTLADKIAIMHNGTIQQFDTPINVYNNPCNLFTAGFIGSPSMNFIDVKIQKNGNKYFINLKNEIQEDNFLYLDASYEYLEKYLNKEVIAGIRPEHMQNGFRSLEISHELQDLKANISFSEYTGADAFLFLKLNDTDVIARVSSDDLKADGENIALKVWTKKILFFDKKTENRIR
ncbi:MAG: ABC transporter ATP-binding protein [Epsilonproteobacteria bacterium]|nr:ABC transporter ATP-binding protein [Campylobacterota bacterium]